MDDISSSKKNHKISAPLTPKAGSDVPPRKGSMGFSISSGNTAATEDMTSVDDSNASTPSQRRRPSIKMTPAGKKSKGCRRSSLPNAPLGDANNESFINVEDDQEWWDQVDSPTAAKQEIGEPSTGGKEKKTNHQKKKKRIAVVKKVKASDLSAETLDKLRMKSRGPKGEHELEKALEAFKADQALDVRSRRSSLTGGEVCRNITTDASRGRARENHRSSMPGGEARRSKSRARSEAAAPESPAVEQRRGRSRSVARTRETEENSSRDKSRTRNAAAEEEGGRRSKSVGRGVRSKSVGRRREGTDAPPIHPRQVPVPPSQACTVMSSSGDDGRRHQRSKSVGRPLMSSFGKVVPEESGRSRGVTPVPAVKDDNSVRRQRSKSLGRASLRRKSTPSSDDLANRDRGQDRGRGRSARPVEDESDRPRARSIGRRVAADQKNAEDPRQVKKKVRSKSIGRSLSEESSGMADIPPPKRWDQNRQRSKSIGPRRSAPETEEDEFSKMANSSLTRGSFFNQSMDSDSEKEENNCSRRSAVPMVVQNIANNCIVTRDDTETECSETPCSALESASAKSIPWDTFLHKAEAEMSQRSRSENR